MKKIVAAAIVAMPWPALAKDEAPKPAATTGVITIGDCLAMLGALNALDGRDVVVGAGTPAERIVRLPYEFGSGKLRIDIARDITALTTAQKDAQAAQQKILLEISKGTGEIKPGTLELVEYNKQMSQLTERPCRADLVHITAAELKLDKNEIPSSVLTSLDKILDK